MQCSAVSPAGWDNYTFLYQHSFNPAAQFANVLIGNDDNPAIGTSGFSINLTAGTCYTMVITGFGNTDSGSWSTVISGPGTITSASPCVAPPVVTATVTPTQPVCPDLTQGSLSIDLTGDLNGNSSAVEYAIVAGNTFSGNPTFTDITADPFNITSGFGTTLGTYTIRIRLDLNTSVFLDQTYTLSAPTTLGSISWTGSINSDWDNPCNWNVKCVPTSVNDVRIPSATNAPIIMTGTAATAHSIHVHPGGSLTIQANGSLTINGSYDHAPGVGAGLRNQGTVSNSGQLILGSTAGVGSFGLFNEATFVNQSNAEINLDRSTEIGVYNYSGGFTNAGKITIGALDGVGEVGLWNLGTFDNNSGEINIDRCTSTGLKNQIGTFTNAAKIVIGAIGNVGSEGIRNESTFQNNACALIKIVANAVVSNTVTFNNAGIIIENASGNSSVSTNTGFIQNLNGGTFSVGSGNAPITTTSDVWTGCLSTDWATAGNWLDGSVPTTSDDVKIPDATNDPVISTAAVAKTVHVQTSGSLTINATKSLTINGSFSDAGVTQAMKNEGTVNNNGTLSIGSTTSSGQIGLSNNAIFNNNTGGEIAIDNATYVGLASLAGTFTNTAKITIGAVASTGLAGLYNEATFNNSASGEIAIDRSNGYGLYNYSGTFTNAAKITIGAVAGLGNYGLYNEATFNNNTGGEIAIDRSTDTGLYNYDGTFTNAAKITIGAVAGIGFYGHINEATFNNNAGGEVAIDRSTNIGLYNFTGTFNNAAKITIGAVAGVGGNGLTNVNIFNNNAGGEIAIDRSTSIGLFNQNGTFTNAAKITIGAIAGVGNNGLSNQNTFNNNAGGEIAIDRSSSIGLYNFLGTFTNAAKITIGAVAGVGYYGLNNVATFNNNMGGDITIDRSIDFGLFNSSGTFTNAAKMTIGAVAGVGNAGLQNQATFNNNTGGEIAIDNSTSVGLSSVAGAFTNTAKITIGAVASVGTYGLANIAATFINNACSEIEMFANLNNTSTSTFINAGLFTVNTSEAHINNGTFINNGILAYPQGNPIPNVVNNDVIVQPVSGNCPLSNALMLGGAVSFTVSANWFLDAALTLPAGTYNQATNTFTPDNAFPANTATTVYFSISDDANGCPRTVSAVLTVATCCVPPVITTCPGAQSVPATSGQCNASVTYSPAATGTPTPTWSYQFSGATSGSGSGTGSGSTFNVGMTTVTLTATNACGNSSCSFVVTVNDTQLPSITCPNGLTVSCLSSVPAPNPALATASDNCVSVSKEHWYTSLPYDVDCINRFKVTRYYRAFDGSGNSNTCSQIITVYDNTLPVFTFTPANVTVQCNSIPAIGNPAASDGCGGSVGIAYNGQTVSSQTCTDAYTLTRQWTATDACGNTKTATQRITVIDTQKPAFTGAPANITVQCDAIPAAGTPSASDNCDATVAITYNGQTQTSGACPNAYTLTRRWTAADNCGNTVSVSQRITVVDNVKPGFSSFPANSTIACNDPVPPVGSPTASDGCGSATVTYLGQSSTSGSCPGNYQIKRTWRATDACGNSTVSTQTIQVSDTGVPVFTSVPGPLTIECSDPLPPLVNPTASDACGGYAAITFLGNVPSGSGCSADYTVTRTWRAEDLCGNSATTSQVITVLGNSYGGPGAENREEIATGLIAPRSSIITLSPNPTTDRFRLDLSDFAGEAVTISVHSDLGQLIWERRIPAVEDLKLSVSLREAGAATGIYTVSVYSANSMTATRVVLVE